MKLTPILHRVLAFFCCFFLIQSLIAQSNLNGTAPEAVEILLPSQYRKESQGYPKNVKTKEWVALYKDESSAKWRVDKANLKITFGRDECVGEDVMIIQSQHENTSLFFNPFEGLSENIETILEDSAIFPEREVSFSLLGKNYQLIPYGNVYNEEGEYLSPNRIKSMSHEDLEYTQIKSYELIFMSSDGKKISLATINEMQSVVPKVVWAGDLNKDGLPDMILDLRDFYESQHLFFFLSDKNDKKTPLKKIADLKVVNDC